MRKFTTLTGMVAPLDRVNVDTDAIIPKQFLKRIERTGFGEFLFFDWRFIDGNPAKPNADFVLNQPRYQGAQILVSRANFGSGSSREHAPWALSDYGFLSVIAPSFADIFFNNCFKNGMLPIVLSEADVETIFQRVQATPGYQLTIDLPSQTVRSTDGLEFKFQVDPFRKECLIEGLDDIGLTLRREAKIAQYEASHATMP
jgi:3-isopropylmalate/(R)-2-methylmalate dehydratase small subunit